MNVDNENTTEGSNPNEGRPSDTVIEVRHLDVWHIIKVYRVGRSEKVVFPICARVNFGMIHYGKLSKLKSGEIWEMVQSCDDPSPPSGVGTFDQPP